ncbi:STAS domain-containing protein [Streptomyces sp. NPDC096013]|uniref:STAS domain-containing protein n=1 Tax=Streptomyces sp. NPDC096013 TaxID=3366069 RepID=UPI003820D422
MTLQISNGQGYLIVQMPAEVDIANAETVRQQLRDLCRSQLDAGSRNSVTSVVVDWSASSILTMAGLTVLEDFRLAAAEARTPVKVVVSRRLPRKVLEMWGLNDVVPLYESVDHAVADGTESSERGRTLDRERS